MKLTALRAQLKEAQEDLAALLGDLPKIEGLLGQHRAAVATAKDEGKSFEERAELRAKADAFASVLAQHEQDIKAQRAEVERLEAELQEALKRDRVAALTKQAATLGEAHSKALGEANAALAPFVDKLVSIVDERNSITAELKALGGEVANVQPVIPQPHGWAVMQALDAVLMKRLQEAQRAQRVQADQRRAANAEPQTERPPMITVTIDLKHEEHAKRASDMLRNVAQAAYQETRLGTTSLAVWALRQSDAAAVDRLKKQLPDGVMTVR